MHVCESMKNKKTNEKNTETQRLLTEMYIQLINLRTKAEKIRKQQLQHKMQMSTYLHSMKKMERIIKEIQEGKADFLQYLDFYKGIDKQFIKQMVEPFGTAHK